MIFPSEFGVCIIQVCILYSNFYGTYICWWFVQETVFKHEGGKNSASNLEKDRSKSSSSQLSHQRVIQSNCDASADSSYDNDVSGLSPWHVTTVNGRSSNRSTNQQPRNTPVFPLTTELWATLQTGSPVTRSRSGRGLNWWMYTMPTRLWLLIFINCYVVCVTVGTTQQLAIPRGR